MEEIFIMLCVFISTEQLKQWVNVDEMLLEPIGTMPDGFDIEVLQYIHTRMIILQKAYPTTLEVLSYFVYTRNFCSVKLVPITDL